MKRPLAALLLTGLLLALTACAPTVQGSSSSFPVPLTSGVIEVTPGQSLYVLAVHSLSELGFNEGDLATVLFVNEGSRRSSGRVGSHIAVTPVRVPAYWRVSLADARFVYETVGAGIRTTVQTVLLLQVPADADLGVTEVRVRIDGRRDAATVRIPLRVRQR